MGRAHSRLRSERSSRHKRPNGHIKSRATIGPFQNGRPSFKVKIFIFFLNIQMETSLGLGFVGDDQNVYEQLKIGVPKQVQNLDMSPNGWRCSQPIIAFCISNVEKIQGQTQFRHIQRAKLISKLSLDPFIFGWPKFMWGEKERGRWWFGTQSLEMMVFLYE